MKKPLAYVAVAGLLLAGTGMGILSSKIFQETYAQEDAEPVAVLDNDEEQEQPKENPQEQQPPVIDQQDQETGSDANNKTATVDELKSKEGMELSDEPLGKTLSWWFKRNSSHLTPVVEATYRDMLTGKGYYVGDTSQKKIYLTFDEGYENGNTAEILDILKANDVKAAFFVTGKYIDDQPDIVRRMVTEGHVVGNHTETHPSMPGITNEAIKKELLTVDKKFRDLTGESMHYLRPPMGEYNARTLEAAHLLGYETIFWSMAYKDWDTKNQPGQEAAYKHVMDNVHNGAIILLHAVSDSNTEALDSILKNLQSQGYIFGLLDELQ